VVRYSFASLEPDAAYNALPSGGIASLLVGPGAVTAAKSAPALSLRYIELIPEAITRFGFVGSTTKRFTPFER
jgi:hypothetical protein